MTARNNDTVLITGVSGNLGQRLLPRLAPCRVIGVDFHEPAIKPHRFEHLDLGSEASCDALVTLLTEERVSAVVHLAFVIDPVRTGVLAIERMWQINVAGTARVIEAIAAVNRRAAAVRKFIYPSSVSVYGSELRGCVDESAPLAAHTLPYAVHKKEADQVVQARSESMKPCRSYLLRPHIFTGASMQNYLVGALRGTPTGNGRLGQMLRRGGMRLPMMLPFGREYLQKRFQFVHVDDVARLIAYTIERDAAEDAPLTILNVAAGGEAITLQRAAEIGGSKVIRLPRWLCRLALDALWRLGISGIPPAALPYMIGSYTMDTSALQRFLGAEYSSVMQYGVAEALADSFEISEPVASAKSA